MTLTSKLPVAFTGFPLLLRALAKQSDIKCHSECFALAQYRLREESQSDCFVPFAEFTLRYRRAQGSSNDRRAVRLYDDTLQLIAGFFI